MVIDSTTCPDSVDVALPDISLTNTYGASVYPLPRVLTIIFWRGPLYTTLESLYPANGIPLVAIPTSLYLVS